MTLPTLFPLRKPRFCSDCAAPPASSPRACRIVRAATLRLRGSAGSSRRRLQLTEIMIALAIVSLVMGGAAVVAFGQFEKRAKKKP